MCKGVLVYRDQPSYAKAVGRLTLEPALEWFGAMAYSPPRPRRDGRIEMDHYLFRPGNDPLAAIYAEQEERLSVTP